MPKTNKKLYITYKQLLEVLLNDVALYSYISIHENCTVATIMQKKQSVISVSISFGNLFSLCNRQREKHK